MSILKHLSQMSDDKLSMKETLNLLFLGCEDTEKLQKELQ